jgi:hypothetical protein
LQEISRLTKEIHTYIQERTPSNEAPQREFEDFFEVCKSKLGLVLDQFNLIFVSITGTHCRTSIKLSYPVGPTPTTMLWLETRGRWTSVGKWTTGE